MERPWGAAFQSLPSQLFTFMEHPCSLDPGLCLAWPMQQLQTRGKENYTQCMLPSAPVLAGPQEGWRCQLLGSVHVVALLTILALLPPLALEVWEWSRLPLGTARHVVASLLHSHISVSYSIGYSAHTCHWPPALMLTNKEKMVENLVKPGTDSPHSHQKETTLLIP